MGAKAKKNKQKISKKDNVAAFDVRMLARKKTSNQLIDHHLIIIKLTDCFPKILCTIDKLTLNEPAVNAKHQRKFSLSLPLSLGVNGT